MVAAFYFLKDSLFTFFKTASKDVTLRQNEITMRMRGSEENKLSNLLGRNKEKMEKERAAALISYEDTSDGGGVYID